jgi:hypothetical protein
MHRAIPALSKYSLIEWCLVKHRDNFTFYLYVHDVIGHFSYNYYKEYSNAVDINIKVKNKLTTLLLKILKLVSLCKYKIITLQSTKPGFKFHGSAV